MPSNASLLSSAGNLKEKSTENSATYSSPNMPLAMSPLGEEKTVHQVRGKDDTRSFLQGLGFVEGAKVIPISENGGNMIINVKDTRIAISKAMATRILVG